MTTCLTLRDGHNVTTSTFVWQLSSRLTTNSDRWQGTEVSLAECTGVDTCALHGRVTERAERAAASRLGAKSIYFTSPLPVTWLPSQTVRQGQYTGYHYWLQLNDTAQLISPLVLCAYTKKRDPNHFWSAFTAIHIDWLIDWAQIAHFALRSPSKCTTLTHRSLTTNFYTLAQRIRQTMMYWTIILKFINRNLFTVNARHNQHVTQFAVFCV